MKLIFLIFMIVLTGFSIFGSEFDWYLKLKQIKILQSTKQDVERLFPALKIDVNHKFLRNDVFYYKWKGSEITVGYSTGKCPPVPLKTGYNGYDLEKDVLLRLTYHLKKPIKVSKLKLDLSNFRGYKDGDEEGVTYYNFDLGIKYGILRGNLEFVELFPSNSMKHLLCKSLESPINHSKSPEFL